ncbi:uncharacterized protein [Drosophila kikkawai]|uniref:Uncharacterized protein n=1 Tax=Drosophila kikkawai TaxID=30033 RepID=A0ABM3C4H1_DROKI|nr:uncharacterized protein LOC108073660 [Drosophila kikkawai]
MDFKYIIFLIMVLYSVKEIKSKFEFTNIKCTSLDKEFDDFEYCRIKSVNRSFKYISLKVKMYKIPVHNVKILAAVEFTNVKCTSLDPKFADFEYCIMKSVNRSYKYISAKVKLFKKPITKVKVNVELMKRYSGYKPFLYNVTVDACRFLKNPGSNPIAGYLYGFFRDHSNMNHTCPFDHDLILEKLTINFVNQHVTNVLPFPTGDYLFQSNWLAYDINRAKFSVYWTIS